MIRVLRVLEYEYEDVNFFLEDRRRWTDHLSITNRVKMSSSIVSMSSSEEIVIPDDVEGKSLNDE